MSTTGVAVEQYGFRLPTTHCRALTPSLRTTVVATLPPSCLGARIAYGCIGQTRGTIVAWHALDERDPRRSHGTCSITILIDTAPRRAAR